MSKIDTTPLVEPIATTEEAIEYDVKERDSSL